MFYESIFDKLNKSHIDYIVVGGVALVLHGAVRLTADLDLIDDLIKLKKISGRPQDIADIAALSEIKKDEQI
ncbi:MAG: hypothetical protein NG747_14545 [Candidatus Brocadia sp.]|nr:hypothetical protein [Candidatus Brocadia sp.]